MNILILGGTKFVGYHITRRLMADGHRITIFNRGRTSDDLGQEVERLTGDRRDDQNFLRIFQDKRFDAVVDVIGYKSENVETAIKAFSGRVRHYIFISSGQVYLVTENRHIPSREEDFDQPVISCPPGEEDAWFYGVGKRGCETALFKAHAASGFPCTILRLPIIQGERDPTLRAYSYFLRITDGGPIILPDGGETVIRHIYVKDLASVVSQILGQRDSAGEVYNLAQKEVVSLREFIELAASMMKKRVKFVSISSQELMTRGLDRSFSPYSSRWVSYLDTTRAEDKLGFKPTRLSDYLKRTIAWFAEKYDGGPPANFTLRPKELEVAREFVKQL